MQKNTLKSLILMVLMFGIISLLSITNVYSQVEITQTSPTTENFERGQIPFILGIKGNESDYNCTLTITNPLVTDKTYTQIIPNNTNFNQNVLLDVSGNYEWNMSCENQVESKIGSLNVNININNASINSYLGAEIEYNLTDLILDQGTKQGLVYTILSSNIPGLTIGQLTNEKLSISKEITKNLIEGDYVVNLNVRDDGNKNQDFKVQINFAHPITTITTQTNPASPYQNLNVGKENITFIVKVEGLAQNYTCSLISGTNTITKTVQNNVNTEFSLEVIGNSSTEWHFNCHLIDELELNKETTEKTFVHEFWTKPYFNLDGISISSSSSRTIDLPKTDLLGRPVSYYLVSGEWYNPSIATCILSDNPTTQITTITVNSYTLGNTICRIRGTNIDGSVDKDLAINVIQGSLSILVNNDKKILFNEDYNRERDEYTSLTIPIKNTGNVREIVRISLENIDSIYNSDDETEIKIEDSLNPVEITLSPNEVKNIEVRFKIPESADYDETEIGELEFEVMEEGRPSEIETVRKTMYLNTESSLVLNEIVVRSGSNYVSCKATNSCARWYDDGKVELRSSTILTVKPGDDVIFYVNLKNNNPKRTSSSDDQEAVFRNVISELRLFDIDDGYDITEDFSSVTVYPYDRSTDIRTVSVTITIPNRVEEREYDFEVTGSARDSEYGSLNGFTLTGTIEVIKESKNIEVSTPTLSPSTLSCYRTTYLSSTISNLGNNDMDDLVAKVTSTDLGIDTQEQFSVDSYTNGRNDDRFDLNMMLNINNDVEPGNYNIALRVYDSSNSLLQGPFFAVLTIEECSSNQPTEPTEPTNPDDDDDDDQIDVIVPTTPTGPVIIEKTTDNSNLEYTLKIIAIIVLLIGIITLIVFLFIK